MKDFFQRLHGAIGQHAVGLNEKVAHLALPALVDFPLGHSGTGALKVLRLQIANQKAIVAQEQRVIVLSSFAQGRRHLGPHVAMSLFVFLDPLGLDLQHKADTLHIGSLTQGGLRETTVSPVLTRVRVSFQRENRGFPRFCTLRFPAPGQGSVLKADRVSEILELCNPPENRARTSFESSVVKRATRIHYYGECFANQRHADAGKRGTTNDETESTGDARAAFTLPRKPLFWCPRSGRGLGRTGDGRQN